LAKIDIAAANAADRTAQNSHELVSISRSFEAPPAGIVPFADPSRKTHAATQYGALGDAILDESTLGELLGLLPKLSEQEREQVLLNAVALVVLRVRESDQSDGITTVFYGMESECREFATPC
jgi:hypothetical protein